MIQNIGGNTLWKGLVYSLYICAQLLLFASLLLTATQMLVHLIFMFLTVSLYFAVSIKNPGVYKANPQPNLEDISNKDLKHLNCAKSKQQHVKKVVSIRVFSNENLSNNNKRDSNQVINIPTNQQMGKKTNFQANQKLEIRQYQGQQQPLRQLKKGQNNSLHQKKNNLFNNATNLIKSAFGKWTGSRSIKNIDPQGENQSNQQKQQTNKQNQQYQQEQNHQDDDHKTDNKSQKAADKELNFSDFQNIEKNKQSTRKVDKQLQSQQSQENNNEQQQNKEQQEQDQKIVIKKVCFDDQMINPNEVSRKTDKKNSILNKMMKVKRYCRMCQFYQPLRVRHCYHCDQCISTFDHHCPWLATCIGQKNKLIFLFYIFFQFLQFLAIFVDLIRHITIQELQNRQSIAILLLSILLFIIALSILFVFHVFLAYHNLTTWQLFRWKRVPYLNIFSYEKIKSPFSKGGRQNLKMLWRLFWTSENKVWSQQVSQQLSKGLIQSKHNIKQQKCNEAQTDRKIRVSVNNL